MEFSKKLTLALMVIFALTWAAAIVSWFMGLGIPMEIMYWTTGSFGLIGSGYYAKSCVENKAKIEAQRNNQRKYERGDL